MNILCRKEFEKFVGVPSILEWDETMGRYKNNEVQNDWRVWKASWITCIKNNQLKESVL